MKRDFIEIALTTLAIVAAFFAIFMAVWYLIGDSPTQNQIGYSLIGILTSWLLVLTYKFGRFEGRSIQFERSVKDSFDRVKEDLNRIEKKLDKIT